MLDKSIPYYDVLMRRQKGTPFTEHSLPAGYSFVLFSQGDEHDWATIETSVDEFDSVDDALSYFRRDFLPFLPELKRRCLFVVDSSGYKVGTMSIWWSYTGLRRDPWLHWISVRPQYQGLGLGKALLSEGMRRLLVIEGDRDVYLHTQTWSYKAVSIYQKMGFKMTKEKGLDGYDNRNYDKALELLSDYLTVVTE